MAKVKRSLNDYDTDVIALIDCHNAMKQTMNFETRKMVLEYMVKKELGHNFEIRSKS